MTIRPAVAADVPQIQEIWNPLIRNSAVTFTTIEKTPAGLQSEIAARGAAFLVAEEAGMILGFAGYGAFRGGPGYGHTAEHTVILAPSARRRGTGRALMQQLEAQARAEGLHVLVGGVSGENPSAIAFHRAIGFQEAARLPEVGRKFGRWMDLVFLHKCI